MIWAEYWQILTLSNEDGGLFRDLNETIYVGILKLKKKKNWGSVRGISASAPCCKAEFRGHDNKDLPYQPKDHRAVGEE